MPVTEARAAETRDDVVFDVSLAGLRDYWDVYLRHREEIDSIILGSLRESPYLAPILSMMTPEVLAAERRAGDERMLKALAGDWAPHIASVRAQGAAFAAMKVPFSGWYAMPVALSRQLVPRLVDAFHDDPPRLSRVLQAANDYTDATMALLGDAYRSADRQELEEKKRQAEEQARALHTSDDLLRKRTAALEAVIAAMRDGVALRTPDGRVKVVNAVGRELLQPEKDEAGELRWEGQGFENLRQSDGEAPLAPEAHPIRRAMAGEEVHDLELVYLSPVDGVRRHYLTDAQPVYSGDQFIGALVTFRDITERRRMSDLVRRSEELERENLLIESASRMKSEFLANMSHELRTPLNAIIGFSELIHDGVAGPVTDTQTEYLSDILSSGRHLLQLINDVLDLSKVEAGKLQLFPEVIDVTSLAREVIAVLRSTAASRRVEVTLADSKPKKAFLDPSRVKQVLYNYLSNAIKFTPANGQVRVRVEAVEPQAIRIEVEDTGIGIAPEDLPRLFREFEQLAGASTKSEGGTGLGLALTRRLAEAMGGSVGVRSTPEQGSTFFAVLPADLRSAVALSQRRNFPGASLESPTVLVVEDDPADQALIVRLLTEAGYAVVTASTGAQAVELARTEAFDAITLDLCLPDSSGFDVLKLFREDGLNAQTPVVVISVSADQRYASGFALAGVLTKPLDPAALKDALASVGVEPRRHAPVLVVDDDPALLRLAEASLLTLGFPSVCFDVSAEALAWLDENRAGAIILDLLMPSIDGFAFLRMLDRLHPHARVPVFVWTVKDLSEDERRTLRERSRTVVLEGKRSGGSLVEELAQLLPARQDAGGTDV